MAEAYYICLTYHWRKKTRRRKGDSMADRLRVFIASSSEQIETATKVKHAIEAADQTRGDNQFDVEAWPKGVFDFSAAYIESLENELDRADFAVVVLTGDDQAMVRDAKTNLPRDNVIEEANALIVHKLAALRGC
jgi:predicted nucleotide-binding protein